ncbi:MAG: aldehyde dehydrogenase family protein [Chloroflexota bacterium]
MMVDRTFKQYINGAWVDASNGNTWDLINPATERVIATIPFGNADDVTAAVDAASAAFPGWRSLSPFERAKYLVKAAAYISTHAEDFAAIVAAGA